MVGRYVEILCKNKIAKAATMLVNKTAQAFKMIWDWILIRVLYEQFRKHFQQTLYTAIHVAKFCVINRGIERRQNGSAMVPENFRNMHI